MKTSESKTVKNLRINPIRKSNRFCDELFTSDQDENGS